MIEWLIFIMIMAVGQFSPGPDMVLLTRVSLANGIKAGLATAFGITCGLMIHAGIAVSGLAFVLQRNEMVYIWFKYLACGYLLWLAYQLLKSSISKHQEIFKVNERESTCFQLSLLGYWQRGFLCNILNPKVAIFLAGVTLPFLRGGDSSWSLILWATIFLEGWLLWSLWVWLLQMPRIKNFYQDNAYLIDGVFAICLCILAGLLFVN